MWTYFIIVAVLIVVAGSLLTSPGLGLVRKLLVLAAVIGLAAWSLVPPAAPALLSNQEITDRFHQIFYDATDIWIDAQWCGVRTWQNPNDVWIQQEIISEQKPDIIIDAGTNEGGSAVIWSMILEQVHPAGRVITIDIEDKITTARNLPAFKERVEFLHGSSTDPAIVAEVKKRCEGKKVLVILDSWHKKHHVLGELRAYHSLVPVGGYVIVQDTNINGHPVRPDYGPGPWEAVEEFLAENKDFESDRSRERLLFTMHPRGYLKRVR